VTRTVSAEGTRTSSTPLKRQKLTRKEKNDKRERTVRPSGGAGFEKEVKGASAEKGKETILARVKKTSWETALSSRKRGPLKMRYDHRQREKRKSPFQ